MQDNTRALPVYRGETETSFRALLQWMLKKTMSLDEGGVALG